MRAYYQQGEKSYLLPTLFFLPRRQLRNSESNLVLIWGGGEEKRVRHSIKCLARFPFNLQGKESWTGLSTWLPAMTGTQMQRDKRPCFSLPSFLEKVSFGAHVTRVAPRALSFSLKCLTFINYFADNSSKRTYFL